MYLHRRQHNLRANYREERELRRCFAACFVFRSVQHATDTVTYTQTWDFIWPFPQSVPSIYSVHAKENQFERFCFSAKELEFPPPTHTQTHTHSWCINNVLFSDTSRQYKHLQRGGERAPAQHLCVQGAHLSLQPIRSHCLSARRDRWLRLGR